MIRVTVELIPWGIEDHSRRQVLCSADIWNVGGDQNTGHYEYKLLGKDGCVMNTGHVAGYKRRAHHTWQLIKMVLNAAR